MNKKFSRAIAASLIAAAMLTPTVADVASMSVSAASQLLGETSFDEKMLPWITSEVGPAKQSYSVEDGALHIMLTQPRGDNHEPWDLQLKHRNLSFKAGKTYEVSFTAKANRKNFPLISYISDITGDKQYFVLDEDEMVDGTAIGGKWGAPAKLATTYKTYKGTFTPTENLQDMQWIFEYADGATYGGVVNPDDEIWFEEMSIVCLNDEDEQEEPLRESRAQLLGETTFDEKMEPWQAIQTDPAEQFCVLEKGEIHTYIETAKGGDEEAWDLQLRHRKLNFRKGHTYEVRFKAKSNRNGLQLCSKIATINGDTEYFVLDGNKMVDGYHNGGDFGNAAELTTEYQTFKGTFIPTQDIEGAEWTFHYADGTEFDGNAVDGDEIWFDDMSIICTSCEESEHPVCGYKEPVVDEPVVKEGVQVLGETSFDYKSLPWHTVSSSPAKQDFSIEDGAFHIDILNSVGADHEKWDMCFRHRNLNFKAGHTYEVSFTAKASRAGLELCSKIGDLKGEEEYFVLDGDEMTHGPHMDGQWGKAAVLSTEYQTFSGTFKPTQDLEGVEWTFQYADGTTYEGNAKNGDEIWFDEMSIICTDCDIVDNLCGYKGDTRLAYVDRNNAARLNSEQLWVDNEMANFISVNQLGYLPDLAKVATFGDNTGSMSPNSSMIELTEDTYNFELVDVNTGKVVYEGVSGKKFADKASGDNVCKLDFSDYTTPGEYYLRIAGKKWRSFNFRIADDIYSSADNNMLTNALNLYYHNRSGIDIEAKYITSGQKSELAHAGLNKGDVGYVQKKWVNGYETFDEAAVTYASSKIDIDGGWYNPDDYGKSVVSGGMTAWTLQNMYERSIINGTDKEKFDDNSGACVIPETGNKVPDILDEVAYELDWMAKMKVQADEPTWGDFAGLYYHMVQDSIQPGLEPRPDYECDPVPRVVKPPTFAATLNYAACAAQAARLWAPYDAEKAENYLKSAIEAYEAYEKYWYEYDDSKTIHPYMNIECSKEELNETSLYAPMYHLKNGASYADSEVRDDAYWAACEIFVSASRMDESETAKEFKTILSESDYAFDITTVIEGENGWDDKVTSLTWSETASAGSLTLALNEDLLSETEAGTLRKALIAAADEYIAIEEKQGYGLPYTYNDVTFNDPMGLTPSIIIEGYKYGSNGMAATNAIVMAYAYDLTKDTQYADGVVQTMDYLLGNNPLSFSYITGYGNYGVENPHHKYWLNEIYKSSPKAPNGVLVSGPSAELTDNYMRCLGFDPWNRDNISQRCYTDSWEAWSVNDVGLDWNASLAWVVSFLQDEINYDIGSAPVEKCNFGDANNDGSISIADATAILQALGNSDKYKLSVEGAANADVIDNGGGLSVADALAIQAVDAKLVDAKLFPLTQKEYDAEISK